MTEQAVNREDTTAATESPCSPKAPTTANLRSSLSTAVARHIRFEKASFHTPGHKGRQAELFANQGADDYLQAANDLTELPGLDDLSAPTGVLADLEARAAALWQSQSAIISVNGATGALGAAILATASNGTHALVPRNAHRSVISALCLARLTPLWFAPAFDGEWGIWGESDCRTIDAALHEAVSRDCRIACVVVVSPTYAGARSDIKAIAAVTKKHGIALIVDEAHGAHWLSPKDRTKGAIASGADAVAHSWHKTLPALTQTGMLHLPAGSLIDSAAARSSISMLTSSSPNYLLLASMEKTLKLLESKENQARLQNLEALARHFRDKLTESGSFTSYASGGGNNPSHLLVKSSLHEASLIYEFLQDRGIFAEAVMGAGVLFMLGLGSEDIDVDLACEALFACENLPPATASAFPAFLKKAPAFEPLMPPHQAMLMKKESVETTQALGRIAAQCLSPCPPGIPILIPGQKITEEVLELVSDKTILVVAQ
ncbi:MAG: aminotransferase class I/II-fold pyridoxal phosphate-dependent enzyme [Cyanobacteria bacterium REEB67]|nr:aminotransferase class I/II-fold pyridoxal phosphate-dependent enzyme [Cyanobacteria bacterium REEB67]